MLLLKEYRTKTWRKTPPLSVGVKNIQASINQFIKQVNTQLEYVYSIQPKSTKEPKHNTFENLGKV